MQAQRPHNKNYSFWSRISLSFDEVGDKVLIPCFPRRFISTLSFILGACLGIWLGWHFVLSITTWAWDSITSETSYRQSNLHNYFAGFEGASECKILAADLYRPPPKDEKGFFEYGAFCHDRKQLLQAMSEGGRIGIDAPYRSRGCNYRWFDVEEICFVLDRFDGLVFVGDDMVHSIYSAFNILLRQDLALGALDHSTLDHDLKENCRCANQFIKQDCRQHLVEGSEKIGNGDSTGRPYFCNRIKHTFLKIENSNPGLTDLEKFKQYVPKAPRSKYRPIPVICSFSPYTMSANDAAYALLKFVDLADDSDRNTPMLWVGPTASGHVEVKGRKGNQEIWDFDRKMAYTAGENDIEVLGMWNMTVQATSWDGMKFGERVAITQAMMVINWLSRLESS